MAARTDIFDLGRLRLSAGEGRRLGLGAVLGDFDFGGETYAVKPRVADATLDVSRMTGGGYALRLRFEAGLSGPCMRCLEDAAPVVAVDAREIEQPGGSEEMRSPYVRDEELDISAWARDAYALALPAQVVCTPECAGLSPECGVTLNTAGDEPHHERAPDARWAKLSDLKFE